MDVCGPEFTDENLSKVVPGLVYMLSGRGGGFESVRSLAQQKAAMALSWICLNPKAPELIMERGLKVLIAVITLDSLDRNVLIETIALCGWLAIAGDDMAFQLGATNEVRTECAEQTTFAAKHAPSITENAAPTPTAPMSRPSRHPRGAADCACPHRIPQLQHPGAAGELPPSPVLRGAGIAPPLLAPAQAWRKALRVD